MTCVKLFDVSEFILSIGCSGLSEYINGTNKIGTTSIGKSRRRLSNKTFLTSLLIPEKKSYLLYLNLKNVLNNIAVRLTIWINLNIYNRVDGWSKDINHLRCIINN